MGDEDVDVDAVSYNFRVEDDAGCSCVLLLEGGEDVGVDIYMFSNFRLEKMLMYMVYPVTLG